jgi:hypothetical protein
MISLWDRGPSEISFIPFIQTTKYNKLKSIYHLGKVCTMFKLNKKLKFKFSIFKMRKIVLT